MTQDRTPLNIWNSVLGELELQINKPNYRTWFEKTRGLRFDGDCFVVGVPSAFVAEYLNQNQRSLIENVLSRILHKDVKAQFQVDGGEPTCPWASRTTSDSGPVQQGRLPLFNARYTFDSFVAGPCNQLARAAAIGVAQSPGQTSYNPLVIYGGHGLGKTHLLHAMGHVALKQNYEVLYVSAEQFCNELITALRERKSEEFRSKYRSLDMLLVDDIQFFSGKEQTGENFYHTFNDLHNANHQIVMTSDRPPRSIPNIPERLRSRLEGGLVTSLDLPDIETRMDILRAKAEREGVEVSQDILEKIASEIQENIRALEGSLNRVVAYAKLVRAMLTPELVVKALKDIDGTETLTPQLTAGMIIEAVVNTFHLTPTDLRSRKRDEATSLARQVAVYIIRQETEFSLAEIGNVLGGRSPATITHAYQKMSQDVNNSPQLRRKVFEIYEKLGCMKKLPPPQ